MINVKAPAPETPDFKNVDIIRSGTQLVLPEGMTYAQGREWLTKKEQEENAVDAVHEVFEAFPYEGSYAFMKALTRIFGFATLDKLPKPFFGPQPPSMVRIQVGLNEWVHVPWGTFHVGPLKAALQCHITYADNNVPNFTLVGSCRRGDLPKLREVCDLTRRILKEESIFKGQAIALRFETNPEWAMQMPKFIDVSGTREEDLIFPSEVAEMVETSLFTPIEHTQECREHGVPLKRGILLEGPFGVGKTLTANVTAKKATRNGWTFIYLDRPSNLDRAIVFARRFAPCVLFSEDIDVVVDQERDENMNLILNTLDGVDSKGQEVMVVLTTNNIETIEPALLRPGRLDAVIPVRPPDQRAAERLIRLYARTMLSIDEDVTDAAKLLSGRIPAAIREAVERAKLAAIRRTGNLQLSGQDLAQAARSLLAHLELLDREDPPDYTGNHQLGNAIVAAAQMVSDTLRAVTQPDEPYTTDVNRGNGAALTGVPTRLVLSENSEG